MTRFALRDAKKMIVLAVGAALVALPGCGGEPDEASPYETVVRLDEKPLALLQHGEDVFVASDAELVKLDDATRTLVRLTDGRYRECPWDPWQTWDEPLGVAPKITPDGSALVLSAWSCGAWAWPLRGGPSVSIARASRDYREWRTDTHPVWDGTGNVPATRDGEGWIACGRQQTNQGSSPNEVWSLAADGSPKERIAEVKGYDCKWVEVTPEAIFVATDDLLSRIDRKSRETTTLVKAEGYNDLHVAGSTPTSFIVLFDKRIDLLPKDGGPPTTIVTRAENAGYCGGTCFSAAADATHLYWTDGQKLARTSLSDTTKTEDIVPPNETRYFPLSRRPSLVLTSNAVWVVMQDGPTSQARKPILARVRKPELR